MSAAPLIECVPNVSEGRRRDLIDSIATELRRAPGALLLDSSSDPDHNRSVFTLVGSPEGLKEAVRTLYRWAVAEIDLRSHLGEHPRMGAVDVVPFIPIRRATMDDCIQLSREVAQMIATEFAVPTYLYAESAAHERRRVLANIRGGGFEGLPEKIKLPEWAPDFGPAEPHVSAGVSAVGARPFLIAYNLHLDTPDVEIARKIARAVRESSGGLARVQAIGLFLPGRGVAQVSMNLLDFQKTSLSALQERVKSEAALLAARVTGAELIGMVPQAAMIQAAAGYLQIENWKPELVLENAIEAAQSDE